MTSVPGCPIPLATVEVRDADDPTVLVKSFTSRNCAFQFMYMKPMTYHLTASVPGYRAPTHEVTVRPGETVEVTLALEDAATLRGRVVDQRGAPVQGAQISASSASAAERMAKLLPPLKGEHEETHSDKDGVFVMSIQAARATVSVWHNEHPSWTREIALPELNLVIELRNGATLTGSVRDAEDHPIPGARVHLAPRSPPGTPPGSGSGSEREARSDGQGEFRFRGVEDGRYDVFASFNAPQGLLTGIADEVVVSAGRASPSHVVLRLGGDASLRGRVVDERGAPLEGMEVLAAAEGTPPQWELALTGYERTDPQTTTAKDGSFAFSRLKRMTYQVRAFGATYVADPVTVEASRNGPLIVLKAHRRPFLRGRAVDANGQPIAGLLINGQPPEEPDGYFSMQVGNEKFVQLHLEAPGYARRVLAITIESDAQDLGDVVLSPLASFRGQVVEARSGKPLEGARISARSGMQKTPAPPVLSDREGRFVVEADPDTLVELQVSRAGYEQALVTGNPKETVVIQLFQETGKEPPR
jgi:protocatechuate 3,4-dioxygenase beta subunit